MTVNGSTRNQAPSNPERRFDWNAAIVASIGRPIKADSSWLLIVDSIYLPYEMGEKLTEEFGAVIVQMGLGFGGGTFYAESFNGTYFKVFWCFYSKILAHRHIEGSQLIHNSDVSVSVRQ